MIDIDLKNLLPQFILMDKNGAALAKALEAGMMRFCSVIDNGVGIVTDVNKMPEWRLDEMAWEFGWKYDYEADIEVKRAWVRDAYRNFKLMGTPAGIEMYLRGVFYNAFVEENWEYGGEPYHFRVTVEGEWTDKKERLAKRLVEMAKNVRSVLDNFSIGTDTEIKVSGESQQSTIIYEMTGDIITGTIP